MLYVCSNTNWKLFCRDIVWNCKACVNKENRNIQDRGRMSEMLSTTYTKQREDTCISGKITK